MLFLENKPIIFVHSVHRTARPGCQPQKGSNSAPAWAGWTSPCRGAVEGRGSQIFLVNADGSGVQRLTRPARLIPNRSSPRTDKPFTTPRIVAAAPDLSLHVGGNDAQRVTFEGPYNVSPRISPDGKTLAFITRRDGSFRLAAMDLATRQVQILTDSHRDESPNFAQQPA